MRQAWKQLAGVTVLAFGILAVGTGCEKVDVKEGTPRCIGYKIKHWAEDSILCGDATVNQYQFRRMDVYVFNPGTCLTDPFYAVFNFDCVRLGALGGKSRNTTIMGKPFSTAVLVGTVWSNGER
jgi:hypothetical protein